MRRAETRVRRSRSAIAAFALLTLLACSGGGGPSGPSEPAAGPVPPPPPPVPEGGETPVFGFDVVATFPHDVGAWTQGLAYEGGVLLESTGQRGRSGLRRVDLASGEVLQRVDLDDRFFGEGMAPLGDRIAMLTFASEKGFVFDRATFAVLDSFFYDHEGWGMTTDGEVWIVSDGTPTLRFWDPETFTVIRSVEVTDQGDPVERLNELEWIAGEVFANVWPSDRVARIDPTTGRVLAWIDLAGLLPPGQRAAADVLNGIAWDPGERRLFVTGKEWPTLFQIRLVEP